MAEHEHLIDLHRLTLDRLPSPTERPVYFPHVSLLYSDMPMSERQAIVDELYRSERAREVPGGGV